jgi:hypothetical protein
VKQSNWQASLKETEFSEALGRLLTDGQLRDFFAVDPHGAISSLCDDVRIRAELIALKIEELEFQAEVLLRKRFDSVKRIVPWLICRLEAQAWPLFREYGRNRWLQAGEDAMGFAEYACTQKPDKIDSRELNRLQFALETRCVLKLCWVTLGHSCPAIQVLFRFGKMGWRELVFSLRF